MLTESNFLKFLNADLQGVEKSLMDNSSEESYPNIFILGLPRSGTTLLSQLLFNCLNFYCTNNLMARFWEVPLTGAFLSKLIIGQRKGTSYKSFYGKTDDICEPHEFSWFWHNLLKIKNIKEYNPIVAETEINWPEMKKIFYNLNHILDGPIVYKPLELSAYHLKKFNKEFKNILFIYIERDLKDVMYSLAKSRKDYFNDYNMWWGSYPLEYNLIKDKPFEEQIVYQVLYLDKMYREKLPELDIRRLLIIRYEDMCNNPEGMLSTITDRMKIHFNHKVEQVNRMESFNPSKPNLDTEIKLLIDRAYLSCKIF